MISTPFGFAYSVLMKLPSTSALVTVILLVLAIMAQSAQARSLRQEDVLAGEIRSGWHTEHGQMAALELRLAKGWKTYWRSPGDAGIPPQFDWSGSTNVAKVALHWPTPSVFATNGMQTLGYHDRLILPIEVTAIDPSAPIILAVQMELGVCKEICLPAFFTAQSPLVPQEDSAKMIRKALHEGPKSPKAAGLRQITCQIEPIADGLRLLAKFDFPAFGKHEVVAIEPVDPRIWVSETATRRSGRQLEAAAELVAPSGQPFALERSSLTFTVIAQGQSLEVKGCAAP